ncbi:MAG: UvrD-helicase domain-containing protein [Flammeovirgaceae bacterium]
MIKKSFIIYQSSAGSGKTYTLAKNYIRLSLKSKNYFKKILAVTFTNKAAEEMKIRILEMIDSISSGVEKNLILEFSKYYNISPDEIIARSENLKSNILHNYSYFMITTIDTFFYSIIQSFTRDLKLRGKFNIEMDIDMVVTDVVKNFISKIKKDSDISKWLIDFSKEKIYRGKDFIIDIELKKMLKNLFNEDFKSLENKMPRKDFSKKIKLIKNQVYDIKNKFEKKISLKSSELFNEILKNNYSINDFSYGNSGVIGFIKNSSEGNIKFPGTRVLSCRDNLDAWVSKSQKNREQLISFIRNNLFNQLNDIVEIFEKEFPKYNTSLEISNNIYAFGILGELQNSLREYRDNNEVILISDISELLYQIIKDESIPFVFEKVGNNINHFLIDEFQDTSHFQWKNFRTLIKETLASGYENIIVGDIKQSIYRWRGSDSQILNNDIFNDIPPELCQVNKLKTNWRSGEDIVNFNNDVFVNIHTCFDNKTIKKHLDNIYNTDLIQSCRSDMKGKGYVEVYFDDNKNQKESANEYTIDSIKKIQEKGYKAGDIGIIVRDNNEAKVIAESLILESQKTNEFNFNHVSSDALDIKSSLVVNFIISIFKYFRNLKDRLAISEIVHFYYRHILISKDKSHYSLSNEEKINLLPGEFKDKIFQISRLPLYELVEEIVRIFSLNKLSHQVPYLQAFMDLLIEYKQTKGSKISSFLEWWEINNNKKLNITAKSDAIQLITIHKSKGLEFDHVIIPFLNWSLDNDVSGGKEKNMWVNLKTFNKEFDMPYPIKYKSSNQFTLYPDSYDIEKKKAYEDNINLMYVSFTRPKLGLFIRGNIPSKNIKNVSDLLYKTLNDKLIDNYYSKGEIYSKEKKITSKSYYLSNFPSYSWKDRIKVKLSAEKEVDFKNNERGNQIHDLMSLIYHYDDINDGVEKAYKKNIISKNEKSYFIKFINDLLSNNEIREYYNPKLCSFNEIEILNENGDVYRLDRVVELDKNSVAVIDYKTGDENTEIYKNQIINYKNLLSGIYKGNIYGFLLYVDLNKVVKI